jgi:predicted dehydrogenase
METNQSQKTERKVNVAVVGLGFMGVMHIKTYLQDPNARILAVCDSVRLPVNGILAGVKGNVGGSGDIDLGRDVRVYRDLKEVLADPDVELVDLCTPTPLHAEQSVAALKAGKFVLCEKPMARTSASAREIVEAGGRAGGFLMPAMCMRFWPGWSWLKEVVREQTYGKILAARFSRLSEMPFWSKQGTYSGPGSDLGGALFDLHIHDVDFIHFLFGLPKAVFTTGVAGAGGAFDHVVTQYLYPGGPVVSAEGGWLMAGGFNMAYTIHCERATIDYDLGRGAEALRVTEHGKPARVVPPEAGDGYQGEIRYVVECVLKGVRPSVVSDRDGLIALQICEAEEKSARSGQVVQV